MQSVSDVVLLVSINSFESLLVLKREGSKVLHYLLTALPRSIIENVRMAIDETNSRLHCVLLYMNLALIQSK